MEHDSREDFRRRERPIRTSQMLRDFVDSLTSERVSVEEIVGALGDRGLGVLIAIFAVPNILPSTVPFGNVGTGLPVIFLAVHLMLGWPRLALPGFLARRTISADLLRKFAPRLADLLAWFEKLLKPRMLGVTNPINERAIGAVCLLLSIVSTLPIPFGHNLPAIGLTAMGLGLIEHDGLAVLLGAAVGIVGVLLLALILFGVATGMMHLPFHLLH